ncbi:hypothetical protein GW17_00007153 [Ensete ventricosum]|nr:hypothetical protein GW17_00007153 [Ensete ventricosum]
MRDVFSRSSYFHELAGSLGGKSARPTCKKTLTELLVLGRVPPIIKSGAGLSSGVRITELSIPLISGGLRVFILAEEEVVVRIVPPTARHYLYYRMVCALGLLVVLAETRSTSDQGLYLERVMVELGTLECVVGELSTSDLVMAELSTSDFVVV